MEDKESTGAWFGDDDGEVDNSNLVIFVASFAVIVLGVISIALIMHHRRKVKRLQFIDTVTELGVFRGVTGDEFISEEEGGDGVMLGSGPDAY
jgi:hypothetical protein